MTPERLVLFSSLDREGWEETKNEEVVPRGKTRDPGVREQSDFHRGYGLPESEDDLFVSLSLCVSEKTCPFLCRSSRV